MWQYAYSRIPSTGRLPHVALCCLEGSTMSNLVHRRRRCARMVLHQYSAWRAVRQRTSVYPCLSPCDGCKNPGGVMVGLAENIQACLRDFQTGTASMARKRHLASNARGFYGFCLMGRIGVQMVQDVQMVQGVQKVQGVQLRPIRGKKRKGNYWTGMSGRRD